MVIGYLVDALDRDRFRPVVVGDMEEALLRNYVRSDARIYSIPRLYNYAQWAKTLAVIDRIPVCLLRRLVNYTLSSVRGLLNSVFLFRLCRLVAKEKIDLIHVNNGMNNFAPILAAVLMRREFLVHFHGLESPGFVHRKFIKRVPGFVALSDYMKKCLVANGIPEERLDVIPNPVRPRPVPDGAVARLRAQYGIGSDDQVVGIVGRIVRWKGHLEFLQAAEAVMREIPGVKLLVVGDYSDGEKAYQDRITRMVEAGDFRDRIIFTGYVKNVGEHYGLMDVCVHASIEPEPFGLVITEAMAYGVPVVASDRGAPGEIISDGETGYLVDPEATDVFAARIIDLLSDEDKRRRMGVQAKEHVLKHYPLDVYADKMEQVYRDILGHSQAAV